MSKINIGPGVLRIGDSEPLYCDDFKPIGMGLVTKSYEFTGTVDNFQLTFMTRVKLFGLQSAIKDEIRYIKRKKEIKKMKANVERARAKEEALNRHFEQPGVDSVLVSVDFSRGVDSSVMIIGRKNANGVVDICNAIHGEEAESLYYNLLGDKAEVFKKEVEENRCLYYSLEDFKLAMKTWPGSDAHLKIQGPLDKLIPNCNGEEEIVGRPITCSNEEIGKITGVDVENNLWFGEITNRTVVDLRGVWATLVMKVDRRCDSMELSDIIDKRIEEKES